MLLDVTGASDDVKNHLSKISLRRNTPDIRRRPQILPAIKFQKLLPRPVRRKRTTLDKVKKRFLLLLHYFQWSRKFQNPGGRR